MPMPISDLEYAMGLRANQAAGALAGANASIRSQNAEIIKLRRALVAAQTEIRDLRAENETLATRLIALLRPKH